MPLHDVSPGVGTWQDFAPALTGWSGTPTINTARYAVVGRICYIWLDVTGTSNATSAGFTAPFATARSNVYLLGTAIDNGVQTSTVACAYAAGPNTTAFGLYKDMTGPNWTASGTKAVRLFGFYELA